MLLKNVTAVCALVAAEGQLTGETTSVAELQTAAGKSALTMAEELADGDEIEKALTKTVDSPC